MFAWSVKYTDCTSAEDEDPGCDTRQSDGVSFGFFVYWHINTHGLFNAKIGWDHWFWRIPTFYKKGFDSIFIYGRQCI